MLTIKRISLAEAKLLLEGAREHAQNIKVNASFAVVDESGQLVAFERMDGANIATVMMAQDKAFTSAVTQKATNTFCASNTPGSLAYGLHNELGGRFSPIAGGIPVLINGDVIGGIGVSSGVPQQDMECAEAALQSLRNSQ